MLEGIDFAAGSGLTAAQIKAGGKQFVCRYLSVPGASKNISAAELANYKSAGVAVVLNYEYYGLMPGRDQGASDARQAQAGLDGLHDSSVTAAPVFFSLDTDPGAPGVLPAALEYMRGAASVLGHDRVGAYGGLAFIKAAFDAGVISYGWQTYAWSGGRWDNRARLRQYHNDVRFGPATVDLDQAAFFDGSRILGPHDDYGQWPRPSATPPPPPPPPPPGVAERIVSGGHESLRDAAHNHSMTVQQVLWLTARSQGGGFDATQGSYVSAGDWDARLPSGFAFWVGPVP